MNAVEICYGGSLSDRDRSIAVAFALAGCRLEGQLSRRMLIAIVGVVGLLLLMAGWGIGAVYQQQQLITQLKQREQAVQIAQQQVATLRRSLHDKEQQQTLFVKTLGQMQARMARLESLGSKLVKVAALKRSEFDFTLQPAVGGFHGSYSDVPTIEDTLQRNMHYLDDAIQDVETQLSSLDYVLESRRAAKHTRPQGWPTQGGWLSSPFGERLDPFTGLASYHSGVDIANRAGMPVYALAAGIVTFADKMQGYGYVVDVKHAHGYSTRYAHMRKLSVAVGDVVDDHQQLGEIGSTGHSTGPHLHLEVRHDGARIDPKRFLSRG